MKKLTLMSLFLVLFQLVGHAQNTLDFDFQMFYRTTSTDTAVFDPLCNRLCVVQVQDTNSIAYIHVKVGTNEGQSNILNYSFAWDVTSVPTGMLYERVGNELTLGLFQTTVADVYFYEVKLEDLQGNFSQIKKYH